MKLLKDISSGSATNGNEGPRIHKFPSPPSPSHALHGANEVRAYNHGDQYRSILASISEDAITPTSARGKVHDLVDGQELAVEDGSSRLVIVHTPGHTPDSICIVLHTQERGLASLFTADSVLGQGTAVFEDLASYIASLQRLVAPTFTPYKTVYPGHGPIIEDGSSTIRTYIEHRLQREAQVVEVLRKLQDADAAGSGVSIWDIVKDIYKDYPENLWLPAARGVGLHLRKLEVDGRAKCLGGRDVEERWRLIS